MLKIFERLVYYFELKFEMDQKVEVDGELGYIKESKGRGEYRVKIRSTNEYHTYHESEITPILTNQDRCVCVFAVYKERKISLRRYNDICKTLFGRWVRDFSEVIENRDGKVIFTQAEIPEYEEEYLQWVGDLVTSFVYENGNFFKKGVW